MVDPAHYYGGTSFVSWFYNDVPGLVPEETALGRLCGLLCGSGGSRGITGLWPRPKVISKSVVILELSDDVMIWFSRVCGFVLDCL